MHHNGPIGWRLSLLRIQTNLDYHEGFTLMVEVVEEYGGAGSLMYFPNMIKKELMAKSKDMDKATGDEMNKTMR